MFPKAWAIANMAWAMYDGKSMLKGASYGGKSNWFWAQQSLEHGLDFLLRCHVADDKFVVQVQHPSGSATAVPPVL